MTVFNRISLQLRQILNLSDHIDVEAAEKNIRNNVLFRGPNAWILAVAIIIASVGLNVNSIPVVIGAMLISPLMGPIFGLGLGLGIKDMELMKSAAKNLLIMVSISIVVSFLYFLITPLSLSNPTELIARTTPTFYDVLIALFGGFAGIIEQCRKEKGTVFSGVAIATALMPPLCTAGFGLASGNMQYFLGAFYLFLINSMFIMLATYAGVKYFKFRQKEYEDEKASKKTKRITTFIVIISIVPSIWSAVSLIKQNNFEANATAFVEHRKTYGKSVLYDHKISHSERSHIELFFTGEQLDDRTKSELYDVAAAYHIQEEQIVIKDYTLSKDSDNLELFQEIYKRNEETIASKDREIASMRTELTNLKAADIPHSQIAKEIFSIYPDIQEVSISKGKTIYRSASEETPITIIQLVTAGEFAEETQIQMEDWLKTRLGESNVIVMNKKSEGEN